MSTKSNEYKVDVQFGVNDWRIITIHATNKYDAYLKAMQLPNALSANVLNKKP